jgi:tRNA (guanine37-N1)-methyltransferase
VLKHTGTGEIMRFDVLTIFPEMFEEFTSHSIIGRAADNNIIEINPVNIRNYSTDKHLSTDDYTYGGGSGMVMTIQPIYDAYKSITDGLETRPKLIYMSPQGKVLTQKLVTELSNEKHLIILCGHYEGIDERVIDSIVDEEISIGDYVLTGGELPAMILIDCVSRLIPGVLGDESSSVDESHSDGFLEYPHYTRPAEYMGMKVPDILLSGHHANIEKWRRRQSIIRTIKKRPDLIKIAETDDDLKRKIDVIRKEIDEEIDED